MEKIWNCCTNKNIQMHETVHTHYSRQAVFVHPNQRQIKSTCTSTTLHPLSSLNYICYLEGQRPPQGQNGLSRNGTWSGKKKLGPTVCGLNIFLNQINNLSLIWAKCVEEQRCSYLNRISHLVINNRQLNESVTVCLWAFWWASELSKEWQKTNVSK